MGNDILIVGASGHGKVIADIAKQCGYANILFLDDDESIQECMGYKVIGNVSDAEFYSTSDFFIAIGNPETREKIQEQFTNSGLHIVSLFHPEAIVADDVQIGIGTAIMAGVVINPDCKIGKGCIINTGATVDHDNILEDYVHVSVGSHLAGAVHVGKRTWIGAGAVVSNNIFVCEDCMVGAGAVVVDDIVERGTYVGVPAKRK